MKKIFRSIILLLLVLISGSDKLSSHPWGGLVIDDKGNIYFTFICPFVDEDHYACVWKINTEGEVEEVLKAQRSPSDIVLQRTTSREIYGAERVGNNPNYINTLWKITDEETSISIGPTSNQELFHIQAFALSENGELFFAKEDQIFKRDSSGAVSIVDTGISFGRIQLLEMGPSDTIYIVADDNLYVFDNGTTKKIAVDLREENPRNLPFRGANILFDMAVDEQGNAYLAYYGNRKVIKVSPNGTLSDVINAQAPWSPHGVDIYNGEIFVLESTLGDGAWWKFWNRSDTEIIPRVRKISASGEITEVFKYRAD